MMAAMARPYGESMENFVAVESTMKMKHFDENINTYVVGVAKRPRAAKIA